jgi:membrane protein implicated in regulation of membrane protease activity
LFPLIIATKGKMDYLTIWAMAGLAMLILEIVIPAFGFLGGAIAAFIIVIIRAIEPGLLSLTGEVAVFSVLSIAIILLLHKLLYKKSKDGYQDAIIGSEVKVIELPEPKGDSVYYRVSWSGSIFNAQVPGGDEVCVGDTFIVESISGSILTIKKEK